MTINIVISEAANAYIRKMLDKNPGQTFRLSVKKTGCSGYSYAPRLVEQINPVDEVIESNGFKLYVDKAWLDLLQDLHIDYVEDNKSGIKQKHLVFTNPRENSRCGCGESFTIE